MKLHGSIIRNLWQKIITRIAIFFIVLFGKKIAFSDNPNMGFSVVRKVFYTFLYHKKDIYNVNSDKSENIKRILLVRIDRIGDMLLLTPAIRALKKVYKDADIYVLASCYNKDVLVYNKNITEILIYEKNPFKNFKLIRKLKEYKFDIAIDSYFSFNIRSALLTYFSRAKTRLGYDSENARYFFNRTVKTDIPEYEVLKHLDLIKSIGVYDNDVSLELNYGESDKTNAEKFLLNINPGNAYTTFIGINPGARRSTHLWQPEKFAELADLFVRKYGVSMVITWGPKELKLAERIRNKMSEKVNLAYRTNILELAALISKFGLFICSDTGPLHIAVSSMVPAIALFGKGDYLRWAPPSDNVKIIKGKKIKDITVEEVAAAAGNILKKR